MAGYWINGVKYTQGVQLIAKSGALDKYYITGTSLVKLLTIPEDVTAVLGDFHHWTGLTEVVIANTETVVTGLDTKFGSSVVFWVPDNMLSAYETEYPTLSFESWANFKVWTIPLDGTTTTLTADYITAKIAEDPRALAAEKVIVPPQFTAYESGCLSALSNLPNCDTLEWNYAVEQKTHAADVIPSQIKKAYIRLYTNDTTNAIYFDGFEGTCYVEELHLSLKDGETGSYGRAPFEYPYFPFYGNDKLKKIYVAEGITSIYYNIGLNNATSFEELHLPSTFASMENTSFSGAKSGFKVYCKATTPPSLHFEYLGEWDGKLGKLYVPASALTSYMTSSNSAWSNVAAKMVGYLDYTDTVPILSNFGLNWYSDEDCTASVLPENFVVGNRYFCKPYLPAEFTIPYNGNTTLTAAYVTALMSLPNANNVTKVIVPSEFTAYENNCLASLPSSVSLIEIDFAGGSSTRYSVDDMGIAYSSSLSLKFSTPSNSSTLLQLTYVYPMNTVEFAGGNFDLDSSVVCFSNAKQLIFNCQTLSNVGFQRAFRGSTVIQRAEYGENCRMALFFPTTFMNSASPSPKVYFKYNGLFNSNTYVQNAFTCFFYVPSNVLTTYLANSSWANNTGNFIGYLDYTDTIPTFTGYTATWYEDEDCTTPIATSSFVSGNRYYVKLTAI